jgi:hypothetical protein
MLGDGKRIDVSISLRDRLLSDAWRDDDRIEITVGRERALRW